MEARLCVEPLSTLRRQCFDVCAICPCPYSAPCCLCCCGVRTHDAQVTAGGWEALRSVVQQQAVFLPIARLELGGEFGDLGRVDLATDPGSLIAALALQQQRDHELAAPMVAALEQLLQEAAAKVDAMDPHQMEEAMRQCAEELPDALDGMEFGVLSAGGAKEQLFWEEDPSTAPESAEDVLDELPRAASSGPALAGLLRAHWPQLLLDEGEGGHGGAVAWRRLAEAAAAVEEARPGCSRLHEVVKGRGIYGVWVRVMESGICRKGVKRAWIFGSQLGFVAGARRIGLTSSLVQTAYP